MLRKISASLLTHLKALGAGAGRSLLRGTLKISPVPTALVIRRLYARSAFERSAAQLRQAPANVLARIDEYYGTLKEECLDVYVPEEIARTKARLPTIIWTHGGAFLGGSKEELSGYLRIIADAGFTVVGVNYSLAPEAKYPTPVRQVFSALRHLQTHSAQFHVDPTCMILAGDSSGAQISAQIAALAANPNYAQRMAIAPTLPVEHIRGVALCCGIFDLTDLNRNSRLKSFLTTVGWSYSGVRDYVHDHGFVASHSVPHHVNQNFPRTFITVGNADPLESQSVDLAETLRRHGVEVETLFYPDNHFPPLSHEYQFDLTLREGRQALHALLAFFDRCAGRASSYRQDRAA